LIADAEAAYIFTAARYPAERIALWGESLGSGVAVALAADHMVGRIVLEGSFTSAADAGALAYRFLPVRLLMKDQFRSDLRIAKVTAPLLFLLVSAIGWYRSRLVSCCTRSPMSASDSYVFRMPATMTWTCMACRMLSKFSLRSRASRSLTTDHRVITQTTQ
jgi:pimeloyl-ACP methyl ester carboxylesterase